MSIVTTPQTKRKVISEIALSSDEDFSDSNESKSLSSSAKKKRYEQKVKASWFKDALFSRFYKITEYTVGCKTCNCQPISVK
jgi:hypothetical protein